MNPHTDPPPIILHLRSLFPDLERKIHLDPSQREDLITALAELLVAAATRRIEEDNHAGE